MELIELRIKETMIDSQNLLISTTEPLIPVPNSQMNLSFNEMQAFGIENETDNKSFHFVTDERQLKYIISTLKNIISTVYLCSGNFCDGQTVKETLCVC